MSKEDINLKGGGKPPKEPYVSSGGPPTVQGHPLPAKKTPAKAAKPPTKTPVTPPPATNTSGTTAAAIKANADRLGLVWKMRPGTVVGTTAGTGFRTQIVYDGDSTPLTAQSLIGAPANGSRVMGIQIPPAGNFIIGNLTGIVPSVLTFYQQYDASTGLPITLTTVDQLVLTVNISVTGDCMWEAMGVATLSGTTVSTNTAIVSAVTPNGTEARVISASIDTGNNGGSFAQVWSGVSTSGQSSFTFNTRKSAAAGTLTLSAMTVVLKVWQ